MRNWKLFLAATIIWVGAIGFALAAGPKVEVSPWRFDPAKTDLPSSGWVKGLGCPTVAATAPYPSVIANGPPYLDPGCPTPDPNDQDINGLLLGKQGPTNNNAAGGAHVKYSPNDALHPLVLSELGYDLRTEMNSHCGFGSPRFDILTTTGKYYFLGCGSPAGTVTNSSSHWDRIRWGNGTAGSVSAWNFTDPFNPVFEPIADPIKTIDLVFDEGSGDQGNGIAILDNIDVNGVLGGK